MPDYIVSEDTSISPADLEYIIGLDAITIDLTGMYTGDSLVTTCWEYTSTHVTPLPSDDSVAISLDPSTKLVNIYSVVDASESEYTFQIQAIDSLSSSAKASYQFKITFVVNYFVN